ncbi:hypothetical protein DFS33DRAFT_1268948 [Desarmillaria ectypa]|nr:hypothetical protein DFS33DRAFT_1268948 [Desarmillaria ectypa]
MPPLVDYDTCAWYTNLNNSSPLSQLKTVATTKGLGTWGSDGGMHHGRLCSWYEWPVVAAVDPDGPPIVPSTQETLNQSSNLAAGLRNACAVDPLPLQGRHHSDLEIGGKRDEREVRIPSFRKCNWKNLGADATARGIMVAFPAVPGGYFRVIIHSTQGGKDNKYIMLSYLTLVASFFALSSASQFGPFYSLGATKSYIIEATTTLTPSKVPSPAVDSLALGYIRGRIFKGSDQISSDTAPIDANTPVTINYKYNASNESYTQRVTVDGQLISTITTCSSGTAVECEATACNGTSTTHTYTNTTIVLAEADFSFGRTLAVNLVTASKLISDDNITWTVESISVPEFSW